MASVLESASWPSRYSVSTIDSPKGLAGLRTASLAARIFCASGVASSAYAHGPASTQAPIAARAISRENVFMIQACLRAATMLVRAPRPEGIHEDTTVTRVRPIATATIGAHSPQTRTVNGTASTRPGGVQ